MTLPPHLRAGLHNETQLQASPPPVVERSTEEAVFEKLDPFLEAARRGMSDDDIAGYAGLKPGMVRRWRRARGIKPRRVLRQRGADATTAMEVFGGTPRDVLQRAAVSSVQGRFETPHYVIRLPLDYPAFCRAASDLHHVLGYSLEAIARALGIRETDAGNAVLLWDGYTQRCGVPCAGDCGRWVDPSQGLRCSPRCGGEP